MYKAEPSDKGNPEDLALRNFYPQKKEFAIKYAELDSIKVFFLDPSKPSYEGDEIETTDRTSNGVDYLFCGKNYNGYGGGKGGHFFVIKGYIKTGEHKTYDDDNDVYMVDDYDSGTELSEWSINFRAPVKEEKTKK